MFSYARLIERGVAYIYRILKPERATLSVWLASEPAGRGRWIIDQVRGPHNLRASKCARVLRNEPIVAPSQLGAAAEDIPS